MPFVVPGGGDAMVGRGHGELLREGALVVLEKHVDDILAQLQNQEREMRERGPEAKPSWPRLPGKGSADVSHPGA